MKHLMLAIHDSKAKTYTVPFAQSNEDVAKRMFQDMVNNKESPYGKHPSDYTMIIVGEYETDTGSMVGYEIPQAVCNGVDLVIPE